MNSSRSRRCFFKLAAASGGALCWGSPLAHAELTEAESRAIREEMAIAFQTRQVRERMDLFKRLVAKYGEEIIADVKDATIEDIRTRMQSPKIDTRDLSGVKTYLWDNLDQGFEFELVEDTPEVLEYRVSRCFLAEAVTEHGTPELGHAFYCAWDLGFCQGLNPDIKFTRTKTLMKGDDCCNHRYVLRASDSKRPSK